MTQRLNTVISELPLSEDTTIADLMGTPHPEDELSAEWLVPTQLESADARPLIGREDAVAAVRRNVELAFSKRCVTLTFLQGTSGTGRTRMLEVASELGARHWLNTRLFYAGCRSSDGGRYAPFSRFLLERFGVTPASSPSQVRAEMLSTVGHVIESSEAHEVRAVTHLLGHIAGVPFPASAILAALAHEPEELLERAADALLRFLEGDARTRPMLLLLDDMQRAEPDAFAMLERILAAQRPLAIVLTGDASIARQVEQYAKLAPVETATLHPLDERQIEALVHELLPKREVTPEWVASLHARSQGQPGTVCELVRALDERDASDVRDVRDLTDETDVELEAVDEVEQTGVLQRRAPAVAEHDALQTRLAALPSSERLVMEWACVIGELFWDGALIALARSERPRQANEATPAIDPILRWTEARDEARIHEALTALEDKNLVVRLAESGPVGLHEFTFAGPDTRAAIYAEVDEDTRRQRHAIVASWLTLTTQLPREGMYAALAQHHERAGHGAQAAQAFLAAARAERARLRTTMAVRHAQRALSLAEPCDPVTRLEALQEIGALLTTLGYYDAAAEAYGELAELAWRLGVRSMAGTAFTGLARIDRYRGAHASALEYLQRALILFEAAGDGSGIAGSYDDIALVQRALGKLDPALTAAHRALHECRACDDARREAMALTTLGFIELDRGNLAGARAHFDAAQRLRLPDESDPESALHTEIGLGKLAHHEGQFARASKRYTFALDRARTMNDRRLQYLLLNYAAEVQLELKAYEQALDLLIRARALAEDLRDHKALTAILQNLALVALARNEPSAQEQLTLALRAAREHGTREAIANAHRGLARMRARPFFATTEQTGEDAESSFRESIRIYEESGNLREAACTRAELGFYLLERGAGARARAALGEAYAALKPLALPALERVTATLEQLGN